MVLYNSLIYFLNFSTFKPNLVNPFLQIRIFDRIIKGKKTDLNYLSYLGVSIELIESRISIRIFKSKGDERNFESNLKIQMKRIECRIES